MSKIILIALIIIGSYCHAKTKEQEVEDTLKAAYEYCQYKHFNGLWVNDQAVAKCVEIYLKLTEEGE